MIGRPSPSTIAGYGVGDAAAAFVADPRGGPLR
jgi:hypothetical protein